jgi:tRNA G18 (ribose-2'-O)-methylase SpoU
MVGDQLEGQVLYERQKHVRQSKIYLPGPTILAAGLRVPENIGSVFRLADAAGSEKVVFIIDNHHSYPLARIRRTARSCEAIVKWEFWRQEQFFERIISLHPLIALELTTHSTNIFESHLPNPCAFLIGNERHGIPSILLSKCQRAVHIPMYGVNGSMNVTHALAIALFEWRRQHTATEKKSDRGSAFRL